VPELERYSGGYNNSTGVFALPYKLKQADVSVNLQYTGGGTVFVQLRVNGTSVAFAQSSDGFVTLTETLFNLTAGDNLDIRGTASTANAVFAPAATLTWRINGYEY